MQQVVAEPTAERGDDGPAEGRARRATPRAWLLVPLLASAALVVVAVGRIDAPFNPSYDGFNTAVWARGAQAVRADGWWDARAGGRATRNGLPGTYAHHPPLTQIEASVAGTVLGDHRWAYRLAALLSSVAAIWCCWGWLGACRFPAPARSLGLLVAAGTPLVLGFGLMLNMEIVWMPIAFALLWAWRRSEGADRSTGLAVCCGVLAALGGAAAHQGILLAAGLGALGVVQARRAGRRPPGYVSATLIGAAVGAAVFLGWVRWVSGGFSDLWRSASVRADTNATWTSWLGHQAQLASVLFGLVAVAALIGGLVLVRSHPELVGTELVVLAVTVAYAVAFRGGSTHPYWNAALLPAVALGGAIVAERLGGIAPAVPWVCLVGAGLLVANGVVQYRDPIDLGYAHIVQRAGRAADVVFTTYVPADWMSYESGTPIDPLAGCAGVDALARRQPDAPVLTSKGWITPRGGPGAWSDVVAVAVARADDGVVVRAGDLEATTC